jgi:hypothetical protein
MKVRFARWSVRPRWRDRVEGPKKIEERGAERRRPRGRIYSVGDGVADPCEGSESLLDVGQRLGRTEGGARIFENLEELVLVALDR